MRGDAGNGDGDGDEDGDGDGDEEDAGMSRGCWRGWRVLTWPTVYMGEVAGEGAAAGYKVKNSTISQFSLFPLKGKTPTQICPQYFLPQNAHLENKSSYVRSNGSENK